MLTKQTDSPVSLVKIDHFCSTSLCAKRAIRWRDMCIHVCDTVLSCQMKHFCWENSQLVVIPDGCRSLVLPLSVLFS